MITKVLFMLLCATLAAGTLEVRTGFLDRLVQFYKKSFLRDLVDVAPLEINVTIQRAPPGYIDSSAWDYDSVVRLIGLIKGNEANLPVAVRRAFRQFLKPEPVPSRRYGGMGLLHKARQRSAAQIRRCQGDPNKPGYPKNCPRRGLRRFPSGSLPSGRKNSINRLHVPSFPNPNDLYYDEMISVEQPLGSDRLSPWGQSAPYNASEHDEDLVVISNPVEARLPSGHLSLGTLRRILEARAEAARVMPTRPSTALHMSATNKTTAAEDSTGGGNATDAGAAGDAGDAGDPGAAGGDDGGAPAAEGDAPAEAAEGDAPAAADGDAPPADEPPAEE